MEARSYNFQNPEVRKKASQKAANSKRPSTYRTRRKKVAEVEKELIREELLKHTSGFTVGTHMKQFM